MKRWTRAGLCAAVILAAPAVALALSEADMARPEVQAVVAMLQRQGLPPEVLQKFTIDEVVYIGNLLQAGDAASKAMALSMLGF
jgi:hypothetical protein